MFSVFRVSVFVFAAAACLSISCEDHPGPGPGEPSARTEIVNDCVHLSAAGPEQSANESCIDWTYDRARKELELLHTHAAFNCCPNGISATFTVSDGKLTIVEREKSALCDCNCLYDIRIVVGGISAGTYETLIIEPYRSNEDAPLLFDLDLEKESSGRVCAPRTRYPWGIQ